MIFNKFFSKFDFLAPPKIFFGWIFIFYTWGHLIRSQKKIFGVILTDCVGHCTLNLLKFWKIQKFLIKKFGPLKVRHRNWPILFCNGLDTLFWHKMSQKKVGYIYGLGPRDQKAQKTLKFHVFSPFLPPHGGENGAKSPEWSLVILL